MSSNAERPQPLEGGCQCGEVRYKALGRLNRAYACHCTACQKRSGSAFAMLLPVGRADFSCEGQVVLAPQEEANGILAMVNSCGRCGTRLFTTNPLWPNLVILRGGTVDDSRLISPAFHSWVRSKQEWLTLPDNIKQFETQPSNPQEWRDALS